ncbi:hypothetical protein COY07_01800 [Candidatus Peregrinibacteria bacterium CG_4_10_14_0_2_um_filter_43_11]|nr:MAG: hypothetical protein COY07_01800 [Candidatus Peregrinibacteria bacterium CG_4_10_14_0_2_um_filter_43_11]
MRGRVDLEQLIGDLRVHRFVAYADRDTLRLEGALTRDEDADLRGVATLVSGFFARHEGVHAEVCSK